MNELKNQKTKLDGQTEDEQAINKENFEKKLEEALVFGRRNSIARTPPSTPDAAICNAGKSSVETLWQDDDLLTSPTFKLVGKTSVETLDMSPRARANSLPSENININRTRFKTIDNTQERQKTAKRLRDDEIGEETQNLRKEVDRLLKTVRELSELTEASSKQKQK